MMDNAEVRDWLNDEWAAVLADISGSDAEIDQLANSNTVAIRYALFTQLLGKIADPSRNLLAIQQGASIPGAWDARSFSTAVVVPWVADNHQVLGTSQEPYASKPLRREYLEHDMPDVRNRAGWNQLVALLEDVEQGDSDLLIEIFRWVLVALAHRLAEQTFDYPVPQRVSLADLREILEAFLSTPSGGFRPLAVTTALLRTLGDAFTLFDRVEAQGINEADAPTGAPGDILCYCHDEPKRICLVVEVKDIDLTLAHVRSSSLKAKQADAGLTSLLFTVPDVRPADAEDIQAFVRREWASGLNIYTTSIVGLAQATFALLGETWRVSLLRAIGDELDERQDQVARRAWHDLLVELQNG